MRYALYGTVLDTDDRFPELPAASAARGWRFLRARLDAPTQASWTPIWQLPDGRPWLMVARDGREWHFSFADTADFRADPLARTIVGSADDGPDTTVRHLLVDQVFPLLLSLEAVVLHASAVSLDGRAVAFIGRGGTGKSTLALHLARRGLPLVADDALVVSKWAPAPLVQPSYPGLRLWPDSLSTRERASGLPVASYTDKKRLVTGVAFQQGPLPLDRIYVVERGPAVKAAVGPLRPAALLATLLSQAFRLDVGDRQAHRRHFDRLAELSAHVPAFALRVPDDLELAAASADRVIEHVRPRGTLTA